MREDNHGKPDRGSASSVLSDPEVVRREYSTEAGLRARASVYEGLAGPDARDIAFEAVREALPRRVLEVGCGWGEFAARIRDELDAEVVAIDLSPRMVELARERGVDARVDDVQALSFGTVNSTASSPTGCSTTFPTSTVDYPSWRASCAQAGA